MYSPWNSFWRSAKNCWIFWRSAFFKARNASSSRFSFAHCSADWRRSSRVREMVWAEARRGRESSAKRQNRFIKVTREFSYDWEEARSFGRKIMEIGNVRFEISKLNRIGGLAFVTTRVEF